MPDRTGKEVLREEFNRWAEAGRGEEMEESHLPIVEPTLALMDLQSADRVLDVGCGSGWLVRRLAARVPNGSVMGIDVSDEMVRRAQAASAGVPNVQFPPRNRRGDPRAARVIHQSSVGRIRVLLARSGARHGRDISRASAGGSAWILINYYRDNPDCHQWGLHFQIPTHLLSAAEWQDHFRAAGFRDVHDRRIPDLSPTPEVYTGRWFRDAAQMHRFKMAGALLVTGTKPL